MSEPAQSRPATARPTTRLKALIAAPEILVMPGAFDPISAKLIEEAGFAAIQCSGAGLSFAHLGLPDYSMMSMGEMVERTGRIARAVSVPVMADGDTGFGNAVNVHYAVREFERAGAAGVNLEDQVIPKRCGHLDGKELVSVSEMVAKVRAARDAADDPDFVINARTDALAIGGVTAAVERANAYLAAGATMAFVDGLETIEQARALVAGIRGPVAVNVAEGGRSRDLNVALLQQAGVARVSFPGTALFAAIHGMRNVLRELKQTGDPKTYASRIAGFQDTMNLMGMRDIRTLEARYLAE